jgi:hypothetical protein
MRDLDFAPLLENDPPDEPVPFLWFSSVVSSSLAIVPPFVFGVPVELPDDEERSAGLCWPCNSAILRSATTAEDNDEYEEDNIVGEAKEIGKVEDEDEDDDMLVTQPHVQSVSDKQQTGGNSGLIANETKKKANGFDDSSKAPPSKKSRLRTTRSGSSLSTKEEENSDDEIDELDESEVEIPNIEPNGVCINLGDGDEDEPPSGGKKNSSSSASSKLNMVTSTRSTRHSAMQQQQALSV